MAEDVPNLLVVDDTPANLTLLSTMLRERGYRVRPAPSGALGLRAARAEKPDLVLLDIDMPDVDGFEVCKQLKADAALADVPVLFISALSDLDDKVRAFQAGGVDYVTKPFQFDEVHRRVATHLALSQKERQLRESLERLRALEKLRDDLVHMLVHDMRSPLSALGTFLDVLLEDAGPQLSVQARQDLDLAIASARSMIDMVNAILDVSKIESGAMVLRRAPCDVAALAHTVVNTLRPLAGGRAVAVEGEGHVVADTDLVTRVIQNLLSNAVKATRSTGHVVLRVAQEDRGVQVRVTDDGSGVPAALRAKIFDKFNDSGRKRATTGLGLAFCKLAVEAHGGAIGLESEEGKGSTFWFTIPPPPLAG